MLNSGCKVVFKTCFVFQIWSKFDSFIANKVRTTLKLFTIFCQKKYRGNKKYGSQQLCLNLLKQFLREEASTHLSKPSMSGLLVSQKLFQKIETKWLWPVYFVPPVYEKRLTEWFGSNAALFLVVLRETKHEFIVWPNCAGAILNICAKCLKMRFFCFRYWYEVFLCTYKIIKGQVSDCLMSAAFNFVHKTFLCTTTAKKVELRPPNKTRGRMKSD